MQKTDVNNSTVLAIFFLATAVVMIGGLAFVPTATTMQSAFAERQGSGGGCGTGGCGGDRVGSGSGFTGGSALGGNGGTALGGGGGGQTYCNGNTGGSGGGGTPDRGSGGGTSPNCTF
jgi:hypothetical protein